MARQKPFTLVDFRAAMQQTKKLGPLKQIMNLIPGMSRVAEMMSAGEHDPENDLQQIEGIIDSMTLQERANPAIVDMGRCCRIADGSGTFPSDVERLLKEFAVMAGMMQEMADLNKIQQMRRLKQMSDSGMFDLAARFTPQHVRIQPSIARRPRLYDRVSRRDYRDGMSLNSCAPRRSPNMVLCVLFSFMATVVLAAVVAGVLLKFTQSGNH